MDFGGRDTLTAGRPDMEANIEVAVHESGHAVARVLSIGRVGITRENAIRFIEINAGNPHCSMFELPLHMPGLKEFGESEGIREGDNWTVEQWRKPCLKTFMGIDQKEWRACGFLRICCRSAAQAKFTGASFGLVWHDYGCSDDRRNVIETFQRIGSNGFEAQRLFAERAEAACTAMDKPDVWRAVLTLAEQLPATGRMPGDTVISIVQNALRASL